MNMKTNKILFTGFLAICLFGKAFANVDGGIYDLLPVNPMPVSTTETEWGRKNGNVLSQVSGGHMATPETAPTAKNTLGEDIYIFQSSTIGRVFSEEQDDFCIGDFCTYFPVDIAEIDWPKTIQRIMDSQSYKDGRIGVFPAEEDPYRRILFTRDGVCDIDWVLNSGVVKSSIYTIGINVERRPHRLFWTEEPFNAPRVSVNGCFVRLLGNPDIVVPEVSVDSVSGVTNYIKGVYLDTKTKTIVAKCNAENNNDGPKGQFVVAYFDSGFYDNMIGCSVVEVSGPDPVYKTQYVGSVIQPTGGGFLLEGLSATISAGLTKDETDPNSPYLYQYKTIDSTNPKNNNIYAISETIASELGTSKVNIYWQYPDENDVSWPFENVIYTLKWPEDAPTVVIGDNNKDFGSGILYPKEYTITEQTDIDGVCSVDSANNRVVVSKEGKFVLSFNTSTEGEFCVVPFNSRLNQRFDRTVDQWNIGSELVFRGGSAARSSEEIANLIDGSFPGYIYKPNSDLSIVNPNLYHEPTSDLLGDTSLNAKIEDEENPFANLASSIYFVNKPTKNNDSDAEVWWFDSYSIPEMPYPIAYPVLPQRYKAVWPNSGETHDIVIASERGADCVSEGASEKALYLSETNSYLSVENISFNYSGNPIVGFWLNLSPEAAHSFVPQESGAILTLATTNNTYVVAKVEGANEAYKLVVDFVDVDNTHTEIASFDISMGEWTHFFMVFDNESDNGTTLCVSKNFEAPTAPKAVNKLMDISTLRIGANPKLGLDSALDVALDDITVQYGDFSQIVDYYKYSLKYLEEGIVVNQKLTFNLNFDGDYDIVSEGDVLGSRFARDVVGGLVAEGKDIIALMPGATRFKKETIPFGSEILPRVYCQNDSSQNGYNPNEEHAFFLDNVLYALRNDLNTKASSEPFVLVEYDDNGKGAMKIFDVAVTNEFYPTLEKEVVAGNLISGPHPFDKMDGFNNAKNIALTSSTEADGNPVYYDRLNRMWARRDGEFEQYFYYPVQSGFAFPGVGNAASVPKAGDLVPWMPKDPYEGGNLTNGIPRAWSWTSTWPDETKVPTMYVGQTLTTSINGLPEVWNASSMSVAYPAPIFASDIDPVVQLIDPTVAQYAGLPIETDFLTDYGFSIGSSGTATLRSGKYYIQKLPPTISGRFYIDTTMPTNSNMVLVGNMVEPTGGTSYLQVNVLSQYERDALKAICKTEDAAKKQLWDQAVDSLAVSNVVPTTQLARKCGFTPQFSGFAEIADTATNGVYGVMGEYIPVDHYGLVATGEGSGWVTLVENDGPTSTGMVSGSSIISMHLIRVLPELYTAPLVVLEDTNNKLSEQLDILYSAPFGTAGTNFVFQWRKIAPPADGSVPTDYNNWVVSHQGEGKTEIHLGGANSSLTELSNTYFAMHYKAKDGTKVAETVGTDWSGWCGPTLAEGWIQRVFNTITPFAQRLDNFYKNAAELSLTMPEQIGAPYRGDIALNMDNLDEVGLLELYHTILNKAESMSLQIDETSLDANKQLLLAASRMADLYILLGAEAYSDAKNPTINVDTNTLPSSVFCFANQLPSLLDEELALLRGRTHSIAPSTSTYPYYNRLMWNFTKGITEGEVAYVNNYQIGGGNGVITVEHAAKMYPQGHGDAYGHYLSAIKLYYRLLRNPAYYWGEPSMMEMLVNDSVVNMDYEDEQKFADAAAKLAQTGIDVVDLTARKQWRDEDGNTGSGYFDNYSAYPAVNSTNKVEQAFGYGEWGVRTGLGAFYNWAVVNSLVPADSTNAVYYFQDDTIGDIVRETIPSLDYLAEAVKTVDDKVNRMDSGMNPLGLSDNAVPFDLNPLELEFFNSHYDQILNRTKKALQNAQTVLGYAQEYGSRLAQLSNTQTALTKEYATIEAGYVKQLISIFGTPYPDDIGPNGTYPQGYNGPDIYHYMWMDIEEYGLDSLDLNIITNITSREYMVSLPYTYSDFDVITNNAYNVSVSYDITAGGIIKKPDNIKGSRLAEGSIQSAYRDYLLAYDAVIKNQIRYLVNAATFVDRAKHMESKFASAQTKLALQEIYNTVSGYELVSSTIINHNIDYINHMKSTSEDLYTYTVASAPKIIGAGMTINSDPSSLVAAIMGPSVEVSGQVLSQTAAVLKNVRDGQKLLVSEYGLLINGISSGLEYMSQQIQMYEEFNKYAEQINENANDLTTSILKLNKAEEVYKAEVKKGMLILDEREMIRKQQSRKSTSLRYADMYYRVQRNSALSKYNASFDVAQRYVFELAKVYDYETGLLSSDPQSGDAFLKEIIATRALGQEGVSIQSASTDGGLWDIVNRMTANWDILKGRLGVDNPTKTTKWFSLRYSLFRIDPGASGDAAWEQELKKYWVEDINANSEFARYCQPPTDASGTHTPEPGLIIPFSTSINVAENFFGKTLSGGETTFSSSDYATKIYQSSVYFDGYNKTINGWSGLPALADSPNVYLVPVGMDLMRSPAGTTRKVIGFNVVDQVMPLPYTVGSTELDDEDWVASFKGLDGTTDSFATIRRHSTMPEGSQTVSSRLVGRSVWNTRWLLVIPGSSLLGDREKGLDIFIHGADMNKDGVLDQQPVSDIKLGLRTYSRQGN